MKHKHLRSPWYRQVFRLSLMLVLCLLLLGWLLCSPPPLKGAEARPKRVDSIPEIRTEDEQIFPEFQRPC